MAWKEKMILPELKSLHLSKPSSGPLRRTELPLWSHHVHNIATKIIIKSHASTFQCKGSGRNFSNIQLINSVLWFFVLLLSPSVKHQRGGTGELEPALLIKNLGHWQHPPHSHMEMAFFPSSLLVDLMLYRVVIKKKNNKMQPIYGVFCIGCTLISHFLKLLSLFSHLLSLQVWKLYSISGS